MQHAMRNRECSAGRRASLLAHTRDLTKSLRLVPITLSLSQSYFLGVRKKTLTKRTPVARIPRIDTSIDRLVPATPSTHRPRASITASHSAVERSLSAHTRSAHLWLRDEAPADSRRNLPARTPLILVHNRILPSEMQSCLSSHFFRFSPAR